MERSAQRRQSRLPVARRQLSGIAAATCLLAGAAVEAAPSVAATAHSAASICSRVSAASVSAIVGYSVPAPTFSTLDEKASKLNDEIATSSSICTYGAEKTLAELAKTVILDIGVTSKSLSASELQANLTKVEKSSGDKFSISSYSGLGVPGYYVTVTVSGIKEQTVAGVSGTHDFGASVDSSKVSEAELGKLAKLAETL
jgi:hypothetical protein